MNLSSISDDPQTIEDCEKLIELLSCSGTEGLTQTEIAIHTGWSLRTVNNNLFTLIPRYVNFRKVKQPRIKGLVTRYYLKDIYRETW